MEQEEAQVGMVYGTEGEAPPVEATYRYEKKGHRLILALEESSPEQLQALSDAPVELAFYEDGPVIFFLFRIGREEWREAPFSWHLTPRSRQAYPGEAPDDALRIFWVDPGDRIIRALRVIVPEESFWRRFEQALAKQAAGNFNGQSYAKHLNGVWNRMSVEDMVENADGRWKSS